MDTYLPWTAVLVHLPTCWPSLQLMGHLQCCSISVCMPYASSGTRVLCGLPSASGCGLSFAFCRTIITLQSTLQLCAAQQKPDVLSRLQNKMPGPPHRARNALLYMDLEAVDLTKPEVARLITMAGLDSLP